MTEETRYIANLQRQEEFDNEVTELKDELKRLEQENKELKETIKQYCQWLDEEREDNDKLQKVYQNDHCDLLNYRSALEEIREVLKLYADSWVDEKIYPNLHYDNTKAKEGLSRINEVLQ